MNIKMPDMVIPFAINKTLILFEICNNNNNNNNNTKNIVNTPLLNALVAEHGGQIIAEMRASDGFINATKMCKMGGKMWADYYRQETTQVYLETLSENMGYPIFNLLESKPGRHGSTWIHHRIAILLEYQ
jgi:hypothetical protein